MYPPIFEIAAADPNIRSLLGTSPVRFYDTEAPQDTIVPYAVHQEIAGTSFNSLGCTPGADRYRIQIDVYASKKSDARRIGYALQQAIEHFCYTVSYNPAPRDPETKNYRFSFDVSWIQERV